MLLPLRLLPLIIFLSTVGCNTTPKPQNGGSQVTTLGGSAPTVVTTTAPQNSQTPTTTTLEKTTERTYDITHETGAGAIADATSSGRQVLPGRGQSETVPSQEDGARIAPAAAQPLPPVRDAAARPSRVVREVITEKATTQIGTTQDQAGILKAWGEQASTHYKSILWALVLAVAAWRAWKREWPLIAAILGIGAILSFLVEWWVGPVAAGAAGLVWAAYHVAIAGTGIKIK